MCWMSSDWSSVASLRRSRGQRSWSPTKRKTEVRRRTRWFLRYSLLFPLTIQYDFLVIRLRIIFQENSSLFLAFDGIDVHTCIVQGA